MEINELQSIDTSLPELPTNIKDITGYFETLNQAPSGIPNDVWSSIKIYNGSIYFYDFKNNVWTITSGNKFSSGFGSKTAGSGNSDESITTGFQPSMIKITALPSGNNSSFSFGTRYSVYSKCLYKYKNGSGNFVAGTDSNYVILVWDDGLNNNTEATFVSFDTNGFTINWYADDVSIVYLWEAYA